MPSSQSFSRIQRRISDSPEPACPENSSGAGVLHHQVRLRNRPRLVVELLAEDVDDRGRVELLDVVQRRHEHPAGTGRRVIDRADRLGVLGQFLGGLARDEQVDHEADDLARGVVLTSGLVAHLRELPQQLLEDVAHRLVAYLRRSQVEVGEVRDDGIQDPGAVESLEFGVEVVGLHHGIRLGGELADVGAQVVGEGLVVVEQCREGQGRQVVETVPRRLLQQGRLAFGDDAHALLIAGGGPRLYGTVDALGYLGGVLLLFGFVLGARLLAASFIDAPGELARSAGQTVGGGSAAAQVATGTRRTRSAFVPG